MSQPLLLTGASGLLGAHALSLFQDEGIAAVATHHKQQVSAQHKDVLAVDLADPSCIDLIKAVNPGVIVHCAAALPGSFLSASAIEVACINERIDRNIIEYCKATGCRLIYLSGTSVYGTSLSGEVTEQQAADPTGPYVEGKYQTEQKILDQLDNYLILRVSAPYGPGQRSRTVLRLFMEKAGKGEALTYYGSGARQQDFIHAADVARAIMAGINTEVNGVFNIASGQSISMKELARLITRVTGSNSALHGLDKEDPQENYRPIFSIEKAAEMLHWSPQVSLSDGIKSIMNQKHQES